MGAENTLRIVVAGLWHLGCVTAACCARHFRVTGLDADAAIVARLKQGEAPLLEPGLNEAIAEGLRSGRLDFSEDPGSACVQADVLWLTYDTPVNDQDESDVNWVLERLRACLPHMAPGSLVLISSQLPVGTCRGLESEHSQLHFAYSPENLRLGKAIEAFTKADRVVVGCRDNGPRSVLEALFTPFTGKILWMRTESAEMVKHGLNAFLALSITFINEVARLCERTGADAREVAMGLKSDIRIGPRAYLGPGGPFAGGTLARDVVTLTRLGRDHDETLMVIPAIKASNDEHRSWAVGRLEESLGGVKGRTVAVLGLTYTPNTDTLRRSAAVELCAQLAAGGARVRAHDPVVSELPGALADVKVCRSLDEALEGADAAVVCTEWPAFREADWAGSLKGMKRSLIIDANGFLDQKLSTIPGVEHRRVGCIS